MIIDLLVITLWAQTDKTVKNLKVIQFIMIWNRQKSFSSYLCFHYRIFKLDQIISIIYFSNLFVLLLRWKQKVEEI